MAGILATPLTAPLQADGGVDASGQVFLRFNFGDNDKVRDAGPRFGLRLGALPEPEPGAAAPDFTEDFTSALGLEFDGQGQGELSLGGVAMMGIGDSVAEHNAGHAPYDTAAVLGYAPSRRAVPRQLEPALLVTAAGPARDGTVRTAEGAERWAFRPVQPPQQVMGPRFRRLATSLLERRHDATTPVARPAEATTIAGAAAVTTRWQFHAVKATGSPFQEAIANSAALLLTPHRHGVRQTASAVLTAGTAQPQASEQTTAATPSHGAGLLVGEWTFHHLAGVATG